MCLLKVTDESSECGLLTQAFEMWINPEEGPAGEAGVDGAFQPRHRLVRFPEYRMDAGDVVVSMVRVAEGTRGIERAMNTLQGQIGLTVPGVQHALLAEDQGLVGKVFRCSRQALFGEFEVAAQQRGESASAERIHALRAFSVPAA